MTIEQAVAQDVEQAQRAAVDLRIHGINNASPASALGYPDDTELIPIGDPKQIAGFWRRRLDPTDAGTGVVREAYSWGGLARTSGLPDRLLVVNVLTRIGWTMLVPFGLANVAYWSRPLDNGTTGRGATGVRLFGLGLTVLLTTTVCMVTMDLFALQCFPQGGGICRLELGLAGQPAAWRVAWLSVLPMAGLMGLWLLTLTSQTRYEEFEKGARTGTEKGHVLERSGLWKGGAMVGGLSWLHMAAGAAVVVIASAWPALFGPGSACRRLDELAGAGCLGQIAAVPPVQQLVFGTITVVAAVILLAAVVVVAARTKDGPDVTGDARGWTRPATKALFIAALALYGAQFVALHLVNPELTEVGTSLLPGSNTAPALVIAGLVGIAASGLAWRTGRRYLPELCGALIAFGLLAAQLHPWLGLAVALAGVLGIALLVRSAPAAAGDAERPLRRTAPGALLGLSLLAALALSALVVLGVGDWLNRGAAASDLLVCHPSGPAGLCVSRAYVWAGTAVTITLALVVLLVAVLLVLAFRTPTPGAAGPPADPQVQRQRRWAALSHRAEPVVGVLGLLALGTAAVAVVGAAVAPSRWSLPAGVLAVAGELADWSAYLLALLAGASLVLVAARGVSGRTTRPLGLLWDLIGFLPRAAHPFAPPCYAERAVPELATRVAEHLDNRRVVVLSAHSLGAVLAVAAFYRLPRDRRDGVRLLTYGTQLRPYFGRLFPDLFGPHVLGTQPCPGAGLWSVDPWAADTEPATDAPDSTLLAELGRRWLSLWRPTDQLGFPVRAHPLNDTDRPAPEVQDGQVQGHGGYPRTAAYDNALRDLLMH